MTRCPFCEAAWQPKWCHVWLILHWAGCMLTVVGTDENVGYLCRQTNNNNQKPAELSSECFPEVHNKNLTTKTIESFEHLSLREKRVSVIKSLWQSRDRNDRLFFRDPNETVLYSPLRPILHRIRTICKCLRKHLFGWIKIPSSTRYSSTAVSPPGVA